MRTSARRRRSTMARTARAANTEAMAATAGPPARSVLRHVREDGAPGQGQGDAGVEVAAAGQVGREFLAHGQEPQAAEDRQQQGRGEPHAMQAAIQRPLREREMDAEAPVQPAGRQQGQLTALAVAGPERPHDARVLRRLPVHLPRQPGADGMADQQRRNAEPQHDAHQVERRHPQRASAVDRVEGQREMDADRAVEQHGAGDAVPQRQRPGEPALGHRDRHQSQRVVDEVQGDVGEEHQSGGQAQVAPRWVWKRHGAGSDEGGHDDAWASPPVRAGFRSSASA